MYMYIYICVPKMMDWKKGDAFENMAPIFWYLPSSKLTWRLLENQYEVLIGDTSSNGWFSIVIREFFGGST